MSTYQGNEPSQIVYTATAQVTGGRNGHAVSHEPELEFDLDTPVAMGGKGQGTNPEQLFAIGWGACFQGALALAAKEQRVAATKLAKSQVRASISLGPEGESFGLKGKIEVVLPDLDDGLPPSSSSVRRSCAPTPRPPRATCPPRSLW